MISQKEQPIYEEPLRPYAIAQEAKELLGNAEQGVVAEVEELLGRMERRPRRNVGTALSLYHLTDEWAEPLAQAERGHFMEVNLQALGQLYEKYGVHNSRLAVDSTPDGELWLTLTHQTDRGFTFREIWGYYSDHDAQDFAPDELSVMVEAIRDESSERMHFR